MRSHLTTRHKDLLIKELRADESLDPGNMSTLNSLKEDYGVVEKFKVSAKKMLDEQFVKWCCKKRRGLSIGETRRELKSLLLHCSRGRYSPPTRIIDMEIMLAMRAQADNMTSKAMLELLDDDVQPSISCMTSIGVI